ncbi:hypothetical protein F5B21DRAFT_255581 [Xylaria acuta]|nr:hypothetical protein F5B21DRAFT_255581 [Xylaria acuta]
MSQILGRWEVGPSLGSLSTAVSTSCQAPHLAPISDREHYSASGAVCAQYLNASQLTNKIRIVSVRPSRYSSSFGDGGWADSLSLCQQSRVLGHRRTACSCSKAILTTVVRRRRQHLPSGSRTCSCTGRSIIHYAVHVITRRSLVSPIRLRCSMLARSPRKRVYRLK